MMPFIQSADFFPPENHQNRTLSRIQGCDEKANLGRVRFRCVDTLDRAAVEVLVCGSVEPGATVVTDGLFVYDKPASKGYGHRPHVVSTGGKLAR